MKLNCVNYFSIYHTRRSLARNIVNYLWKFIDDFLVMVETEIELVNTVYAKHKRFEHVMFPPNIFATKRLAISSCFRCRSLWRPHRRTIDWYNEPKYDNTKNRKYWNIWQPSNLKELQRFLGVAYYFRDHVRNHSIFFQPMTAIVTESRRKNILFYFIDILSLRQFSYE